MHRFIDLRSCRRWLVQVTILLFVLNLALPITAAWTSREKFGATAEQPADYVSGEVIVKFKDGVTASTAMRTLTVSQRALGLTAVQELPFEAALFTTTADVMTAVAALQRDPRVAFAEPNYIYRTHVSQNAPNDPLWNEQWGVHHEVYGVQAIAAWAHTKGSPGIIVSIIDTGIDYTHEDLRTNMWINPDEIRDDGIDNDNNGYIDDIYGYDFIGVNSFNIQPDNDPMDIQGHGTHVAGIVAATANNSKGIAGAAPGVRLMAVKALDDFGSGTVVSIASAIHYSAENGAQVVNMSLGGRGLSRLIYEAIAAHPDVLFIAAAGNSTRDNDIFPVSPAGFTKDWDLDGNPSTIEDNFPALPHIMSVAALTEHGNLASFSNFGATSVDLAAPGQSILSTIPDGGSAVAGTVYQSMFWGFGADDLVDPSNGTETLGAVYDSIIRVINDFFGLTPAYTAGNPILLVDDDQSQSPNAALLYRNALTKAGYNYTLHEVASGANGPAAAQMNAAGAVIWLTGQAWSSNPGENTLPNITPNDQTALSNYLSGGGKLFLSGRDAGWWIENTPFYRNYLQADFAGEFNVRPSDTVDLTGIAPPYLNANYTLTPGAIYIDLLRSRSGSKSVLHRSLPPYKTMSGTSMAAPFVAGGGALLLSLRNDLTPMQVIDLLNDNVTKLDPALTGKVASGGTLNLALALAAIPPTVKSTSPKAGDTEVPVGTDITVTFNKNVTESVFFADTSITNGSVEIAYAYNLSGNTLTLNPVTNLAYNKTYTVNLPAGALRDASGNPSISYTFSFTTPAASSPTPEPTPSPDPPISGGPAPGPTPPSTPTRTITIIATGEIQTIPIFGGALTFDIPAGALPAGTKVTITLADDTPKNTPAGAITVSDVFSLKSSAPLSKPIRISLRYDTSKLGGLNPRSLMIFRENSGGSWERLGGKLDRATQTIVIYLYNFSNYTVLGTPKTFSDIQGHWAQANIELLAARELIRGRTIGKFVPSATITRAEMAALLVRLTGTDETTPAHPTFSDVSPGAWYYAAIEASVRAGLFKGYADGSFQPDATLTREQLAALAIRLTGDKTGTPQMPFGDRAAIAPWAKGAVAAAYAQGLLLGISSTEFAPQMAVTRAQAAALMARLADRTGMFEVTTTATGTLTWNTLVGGFWELTTDQETYVLLLDPRHKAASSQLRQFENQTITVTGYLQTGPNIYMRGPLLHILNITIN